MSEHEEKQPEPVAAAPGGDGDATRKRLIIGAVVVVGAVAAGFLATQFSNPGEGDGTRETRKRAEYILFPPPEYSKSHSFNSEAVLVWGGDHHLTDGLKQNTSISNIRHADYAGAESCAECHEENYETWQNHSHRWMNAVADERSVKGDFSGDPDARINYRGGTGEFYREGGGYKMRLSRDGVVRVFDIKRTLGSRVHQYYIGVLEDGPEEEGHALRTTEHVLPFGYELTLKDWIPIVHAPGHTGRDAERDDPFVKPSGLPYDATCSMCHTTQPMGTLMLAMFKRFAAYSPRDIHFEASNYFNETNPEAIRSTLAEREGLNRDNLKRFINDITRQAQSQITQDNAVNIGISCEACHLGSAAHVANEDIDPPFFPSGEHVFSKGGSHSEIWGRNAGNKNFTCARCHSGARPQFAAGMSTWNSTEHSDAQRGHCYHPDKAEHKGMDVLTCVACHNPHESIGRKWKKTPEQDRASCVKCHTQYKDPAVAQAHTKHLPGSTGSQCMNCHMPKINEGLGDMVRTHTIFKPTNVAMLETGQPNACNMCHVEKSIDWTLGYLGDWYGLRSKSATGNVEAEAYSSAAIDENYPSRTGSAAHGWLQSSHLGTRMVGADVLLKAKADWALPELLDTLDDPHMEARQFTVQRLRDYFDINTDDFGYKQYMTEEERKAPLEKMRQALLPEAGVGPEKD